MEADGGERPAFSEPPRAGLEYISRSPPASASETVPAMEYDMYAYLAAADYDHVSLTRF